MANSSTKSNGAGSSEGPLWEVFVQDGQGQPHTHAGSLHAPDAPMAMQNARDVYSRRGKVLSIWVVPASALVASSPGDKEILFDPSNDKVYRHPQFYKVPRGVKNIE